MKKDKKISKEIDVAKREATRQSLEQIKQFLEQAGIKLPNDFDKKIMEESRRFFGGRLPSIIAFYNVIACCNYWKAFCETEEEYYKLVCDECYAMSRIGCSVISTHKDLNSYIGKICRVKGDELLPECTTTVASAARCSLFKGMGAAEKVLPPLH